MHRRVHQLGIPALITLLFATLGAQLAPRILGVIGIPATSVYFLGDKPIMVSLPWLAWLPLVGAVGAYWSRRAGGGWKERLLSALTPAISMWAIVQLTFIGLSLFMDSVIVAAEWMALFSLELGWVLAPAVALIIGALPFVLWPKRSAGQYEPELHADRIQMVVAPEHDRDEILVE
jgi:hypothetical protein